MTGAPPQDRPDPDRGAALHPPASRVRRLVVKYGGAAMTSPQLAEQFARTSCCSKLVGMRPIIRYGGGPEITRQMGRLGLEPVIADDQRVGEAATLEVAGHGAGR